MTAIPPRCQGDSETKRGTTVRGNTSAINLNQWGSLDPQRSPLTPTFLHCSHSNCQCYPVAGKIRLLLTAIVVISCFSAAELIASHFSHSLALSADAGHMLSDCLALGLALIATWISQWSNKYKTFFGNWRIEILAALVNGVGLLVMAGWMVWSAFIRLQEPPVEILGLPMLVTATIGLFVNILNAVLLHGDSQHDINLKGAFLHVVADAISSTGAILAAISICLFHWNWADSVISLGVAGLIALSAISLIRQSLKIV